MRVHEFEAREGGWLRISLVYDDRSRKGKTARHADIYHGHFVKFVPNEEIVEVDEFETEDPAFRGEMKVTFRLVDADGGTDVVGLNEGLPQGCRSLTTSWGGEWY